MMLPNRISARQARPAVALLMVGCLVSFTLGQQLGYALRYPELHASTIPTAHAAGQLSGRLSAPSSRLSAPSGPSGQQARPVVTTPPPSHTAAPAATKQGAALHGKKDKQGEQDKQGGKDKQGGQQGNPIGQGGQDKHQKGGDGHEHGRASDD